MRRARRRCGAAYPVSEGGVGARAAVQRVVAVSGHGSTSLVVQGALGAAAGAFLGLLEQRGGVRLRLELLQPPNVSYLCCLGPLRWLRRVRLPAADGGQQQQRVPASAQPPVGRGSETHKRSE